MDAEKRGFIIGFFLGVLAAAFCIVLMALLLLDFHPPSEPPGCTGFSKIRPLDWKADSYGKSMLVTLVNDAGVKVYLNHADVYLQNASCSKDINKELRAGEHYEVSVSACAIPNRGEDYKADINISYTILASETRHNSNGECHEKAE